MGYAYLGREVIIYEVWKDRGYSVCDIQSRNVFMELGVVDGQQRFLFIMYEVRFNLQYGKRFLSVKMYFWYEVRV